MSRSGRYHLIESGRGAASLAVLSFHSLNLYTPAALGAITAAAWGATRWGWLGVDVFFALSEVGFYLLAAAGLIWLQRFPRGKWALFAAGTLLCFAPWAWGRGAPPWLVLALWPSFFAGAAAWFAVNAGAPAAGWAVLAALAAAAAVDPVYHSPGRIAAVATAIVLAAFHPWDARLSAPALSRGFAWMGGLSYSLYLIHLPLLSAFMNLGRRFVAAAAPGFTALWLAGLTFAIAGGWALNRLVEAPVERRRKAWARAARTS